MVPTARFALAATRAVLYKRRLRETHMAMDTSGLSHHIHSRYNAELEGVRSGVLQMGGLVEQQVQNGVRAVVSGKDAAGMVRPIAFAATAEWIDSGQKAVTLQLDKQLLHDAGVLRLVSVDSESKVEPATEGGCVYTYRDEDGGAHAVAYKTFVDAVGQPVRQR